jgi:hypothetical protein
MIMKTKNEPPKESTDMQAKTAAKETRKVLEAHRLKDGDFAYGKTKGTGKGDKKKDKDEEFRVIRSSLQESAGRSPLCETTLVLLGGGSIKDIQFALENFHTHWDKLLAERRKNGFHTGPYEISWYYFYFGHRYAAQAIQMLPEEFRAKERERLFAKILNTRDDDGTWNDSPNAKNWTNGTAMIVLALLGDRAPVPPRIL